MSAYDDQPGKPDDMTNVDFHLAGYITITLANDPTATLAEFDAIDASPDGFTFQLHRRYDTNSSLVNMAGHHPANWLAVRALIVRRIDNGLAGWMV